jgi:hypothetical protein
LCAQENSNFKLLYERFVSLRRQRKEAKQKVKLAWGAGKWGVEGKSGENIGYGGGVIWGAEGIWGQASTSGGGCESLDAATPTYIKIQVL